jgi:hypothetical protein
MGKDYLRELSNELEEAGGLAEAVVRGKRRASLAKKAARQTEQPPRKVKNSPEAKLWAKEAECEIAKTAEAYITNLLLNEILDPNMPSSKLPDFLAEYQIKIMGTTAQTGQPPQEAQNPPEAEPVSPDKYITSLVLKGIIPPKMRSGRLPAFLVEYQRKIMGEER